MFTGLVQAVGYGVLDKERGPDNQYLLVTFEPHLEETLFEIGESVAINGCCLTVVDAISVQLDDCAPGTSWLGFEMSPETLDRTNLGGLYPRKPVNVERAMRPIDRFGGHIVQGHVDAVGQVMSLRHEGEFTVFRFAAPLEYDRYLIDKGSIAIDGISLTVVEPSAGEFDVWVIPHTLNHTTLGNRKPGDPVNLEFDVLAKYLEKLSAGR